MSNTPEVSPSPTVRTSFALPVGGGFLNASANLPAGQTTLTQLLPIIQNLENAIVGRIGEEAVQEGSPISCKAGCGACCRQLVPVNFFEAEALTEWMATLPEERRTELEGRFHRALLALRNAGVIDKILDDRWPREPQATTQLAIDYFHAHVPCPFLEDESCSIHPIRPLSCREYLVTSPPALCQDPSANQVAGVRLPLKLSRVLFAIGQQMSQDPRGWIPLVFLMAWGKGGERPGDYFSGTGEEVLRRFLKQVAEMPPIDDSQPVDTPAGQVP
ncbi:MAG TPA: YkgJ family cysteine cluster protein [Silvibacterium sp.]|nr:YkgJ family cysteine cluster protein [Silvibacterium sp.]